MAPTEVRVTIARAKHLKNVNWRSGALRPYIVAWLDSAAKSSTRVAVDIDSDDGGVDAAWDGEVLTLPIPPSLTAADAVLCIDVVHAAAPGDEVRKPLVGSARLPLRDILDDSYGAAAPRSLKLKRPSGRPQGKIEVEVAVRDSRYYAPPAPRSVDYGYPYSAPPQYGAGAPPQYGAGAPPQYAAGAPPQYAAAAPPQYAAGASAYGAQGYPYGYGEGEKKKKESKFGLGTGLAVGAAAGLVGGLALAEGADYVEDKIADHAAEKVEEDLGFNDDDVGGDW